MRRLGLEVLLASVLVCQLSAIVIRRNGGAPLNASRHLKAIPETVGKHTADKEGEDAHKWNRLHNNSLEDHADARAWKSSQPPSLADPRFAGNVLPPKCAADAPSDPYFDEQVPPDGVHVVCKYRKPCDRTGTNLERLNSIRGLIKNTKLLLDYLQVPYALYGGSAIGQQRCQDVLPWDSDCDVMIWMHDVYKIQAGDFSTHYTVMHTDYQNNAIPYVVVDKTTGFYCDIFFMQYDPASHQVGMAWPGGSHECPWMDRAFPFSPYLKRCNIFPASIVTPFTPCTLDGVQHTCFKDQLAYLKQEYGAQVHLPNVTTQLGSHTSTEAEGDHHQPTS